MTERVRVYKGEALARYGFGEDHPFGPDRHDVFHDGLMEAGMDIEVSYADPCDGDRDLLALFHTDAYIERVAKASSTGNGWLDAGDTPAFPGVYEAAATVAGTVRHAVDAIMAGECRTGFVPIAGLHHARRDSAGGFCVFNDCGIAVEYLRREHGLKRIAYVDIDAHHGDGVFYGFEDDPDLLFADIHEDGRFLYPGTGHRWETGKGAAEGTKLNVPMPPSADDSVFRAAWSQVEAYLEENRPEFIILQCGADAMAGDPITHLAYTEASYSLAASRLWQIAAEHCEGRLLATGGGGYNRPNLARAWRAVVRSLLDAQ